VHVGLGGQAAAQVEKLADTRLPGQVPHHPAEERPVVPGDRRDVRYRGDELLGRLAVGGEVVLTARMLPQSTQDREQASWKTCSPRSMTVAGAAW
jgi:hypothetical protein